MQGPVLIADRGETAAHIAHTCRRLGLEGAARRRRRAPRPRPAARQLREHPGVIAAPRRAGARGGDVLLPFCDPLLAKTIAHAPTRTAALELLASALDGCGAEGVRIEARFLAAALHVPGMRDAATHARLLHDTAKEAASP